MSTLITTTSDKPSKTRADGRARPASNRHLIVLTATALLIALGLLGVSVPPASAWVKPDGFDNAACYPSARKAVVNVELLATNNEYVQAAAALVRDSDQWWIATAWTPMTGRLGTNYRDASFAFTNLPPGTYTVHYIYRGWANGVEWNSGWKQVYAVSTMKPSNMSGVYYATDGCRF